MKHKSIDYDSVSSSYDEVRSGYPEMVTEILRFTQLDERSLVLDMGCGTANNTGLLSSASESKVIGIDLSFGMLEMAAGKFPKLDYVQSPGEILPFKEAMFDLVYMTEVAHHISDIESTLEDIYRILQVSGKCCIVTQSHRQIEKRMTSRFFSETVKIDQKRYPAISHLCSMLKEIGFSNVNPKEYIFTPVSLANDFLNTVEQKGFSMLRKISEASFLSGLERLRSAMERNSNLDYAAEYTFVWATK